jgi:hypothetical protein
MAQVTGQRTTSQAATESRAVRRVDSDIALLEPNIGPLITLMMRMQKRRAIDATKHEWYEDDYTARWAQNGTATVASNTSSTTITVTDGTIFTAGDMFCVPKSSSSTTAPEVCRVTAVTSNTITIVRAIGGVGLDTIVPNAPLRLIGSAFEEGGLPGAMKSTAPAQKYNYTQIFRTFVDFSKTNTAIKQYGTNGSDRQRELKKKLKEHKIGMASSMMWGVRSEDLTGGPTSKPVRTMGGLNYFVQTNVVDAGNGGTLNRKAFESFSRTTFRYGNKKKLLLAAPMICSAINAWGNSWLQVRPQEEKLGVQIQSIYTAHGQFMLVNDWMLEDGFAGLNGFGNVAFALDMDEVEYRYLSNNGENRDTHLNENIIRDGRDSYVDEYLTECSLKVGMEKFHSKLINVTDYME